jgi:hypothetical protein
LSAKQAILNLQSKVPVQTKKIAKRAKPSELLGVAARSRCSRIHTVFIVYLNIRKYIRMRKNTIRRLGHSWTLRIVRRSFLMLVFGLLDLIRLVLSLRLRRLATIAATGQNLGDEEKGTEVGHDERFDS